MTKLLSKKSLDFERAISALSLASWNRPRSSVELRSFRERREAVVDAAEL